MQKPIGRGHIEALVVASDDNVDDLSTSEMSVPKGHIRVSGEQPRVQPSKLLPPHPKPVLSQPRPPSARPPSGKAHTRVPSDRIASLVGAKNSLPGSVLKVSDLAAISCSSMSAAATGTLEERLRAIDTVLSPKGANKKQVMIKPGVSRPPCKFCGTAVTPGKKLRTVIYEQLYNKYEATTQNTYNVNVINDIILNANTRIVAIFKEYLIYDDLTDFLKASYATKEAKGKLKQLTDFYDKSSKVFPNFIALEEKKYMFKNIERKQKAIDQRHKQQQSQHSKPLTGNRLFTKKFLEEITMRCSRISGPPPNEKSNLADLVDKFIAKDSMSQINKSGCESIEATFCALKAAGKANIVEELQKMIEAAKRRPAAAAIATAKINNFVGAAAATHKKPHAVELKPQKKQHHQSQEDILKPTQPKISHGLLSGRMSAAGNYCSSQPATTKADRNLKALSTNQNVRLPAGTKLAMGDIDPLQININLNLILNKEKSRSGTPHTCTAADVYRYKSLEKLNANLGTGITTSRGTKPSSVIAAHHGKKNSVAIPKAPSAGANVEIPKKSARSSNVKSRQEMTGGSTTRTSGGTKQNTAGTTKIERVASNANLLAGTKLVGSRPVSGRASAIPKGTKKLAMEQLCKNIKELLGPIGPLSCTNNDKLVVPAAATSRLSPRKDKFCRDPGGKVISAPVEAIPGAKKKGAFMQRRSEAEIPKGVTAAKKRMFGAGGC